MENEISPQQSVAHSSPPSATALFVAAGLIVTGAILCSFSDVNEQLFRVLNALLPIQNLWLPFTAMGDGRWFSGWLHPLHNIQSA